MTVLNRETKLIQNPALGSVLLWRFTTGYAEGSEVNNPTPLPLLFLVLPIALHQETAKFVKSTQKSSGLRGFAGKFNESKHAKNDLILSIHPRSVNMRSLTLHSLRLALTSRLVTLDAQAGTVIPLSATAPRAGVPESVRTMLRAVEKLGVWCAQVSLHEVSVSLKVGF